MTSGIDVNPSGSKIVKTLISLVVLRLGVSGCEVAIATVKLPICRSVLVNASGVVAMARVTVLCLIIAVTYSK